MGGRFEVYEGDLMTPRYIEWFIFASKFNNEPFNQSTGNEGVEFGDKACALDCRR